MKTKAAVLRNVGGPLIIEELEIPALKSGQVLVKIMYSGLCRSQLNEIAGRKGREYIPHLLGHEASGIVIDIASDIKKVRTNNFVAISWLKGWGLDSSGAQYKSSAGIVNAGPVATLSEFAIVPENRVVKISETIDSRVASILGCAVLAGMGMVDELDASPENKKIAIWGIGGVGASALMRAIYKKFLTTAVDVVDWKLNWAKEIGSCNALKPQQLTTKDFDFALECSGNKKAMEGAFDCLKYSGRLVIAGNLEPGEKFSINPFELIKGKTISGSWGGGSIPDRDIPIYVSDYKRGLPIEKLITREYNLDDINCALEDLADGKLIRGVVKCQQ